MVETLAALAARTTSDVSGSKTLHRGVKSLIFMLNLTAALKDAGDKLDIYIQESPDEGTTWNDIVHFAQISGTAPAAKTLAKINCEVAPETELGAVADASLGASSVLQGPIAPYIRSKWVVTPDADNPADHAFTFGITYLENR